MSGTKPKRSIRRKIAIAAAVVFAAAIVGSCIFFVVALSRFQGFGGRSLSDEECLRIAREEGQPVVATIYRYKERTGLFPMNVQDALPGSTVNTYRPKQPGIWMYSWEPWGPYLDYKFSWDEHMAFLFDPTDEDYGWQVFRCGPWRVVPMPLSAPSTTTNEGNAGDAVTASVIAELDRWIGDDRRTPVHRQGKISYLVRLHRYDEALVACNEYIEALPADKWPRWAIQFIQEYRNRPHEVDEAFSRLLRRDVADEGFLDYR